MKTTETVHAEHTLLYLLTGDTRNLRDVFPKKRGVKRRKLASKAPAEPPKKKKRKQPVHNAYMDIAKAHQRFIEEGHARSHSHKVGHIVSVNGFRLMSNHQELPKNVRELPYHREFTQADWNHANVGPQPHNQ